MAVHVKTFQKIGDMRLPMTFTYPNVQKNKTVTLHNNGKTAIVKAADKNQWIQNGWSESPKVESVEASANPPAILPAIPPVETSRRRGRPRKERVDDGADKKTGTTAI